MKQEIRDHLNSPKQLEHLYRSNPSLFKKEFAVIFPEIHENPVAQSWHERLNFKKEDFTDAKKKEFFFVILASFVALFIVKIPKIFSVDESFFMTRDLSFTIFPTLIAYFLWVRDVGKLRVIVLSALVLVSAVYINVFPDYPSSSTLDLACIYLPLFLGSLFACAYLGKEWESDQARLDFLKYMGDLLVITAIILIAGTIFSGISIALFIQLNRQIADYFTEYAAVWGIVAAPLFGTYLVRSNPALVGKVSPVIAKIFTPLFLVTLLVYLAQMFVTNQNIFHDRDFLMAFNFMLVCVMAIIFFSVVESVHQQESRWNDLLLLGLSLTTVAINAIALTAIVFRIAEWGVSPKRLAVLGTNILILVNLILVVIALYKVYRGQADKELVVRRITRYLPIYSLWTILVLFVLPVLFQFR